MTFCDLLESRSSWLTLTRLSPNLNIAEASFCCHSTKNTEIDEVSALTRQPEHHDKYQEQLKYGCSFRLSLEFGRISSNKSGMNQG